MRRALLLLFLATPSLSLACTCMGPNPACSAYWKSDVVFRGRVIEQTEETPSVSNGSEGFAAPQRMRVRFSVLEAFRGGPEGKDSEIDIFTNEQESACGFPFETGAEYLVFAGNNERTGEHWTSICTRTHELSPDVREPDVMWMRSLGSAPKGATIFGSLRMTAQSSASMPAATIQIAGPENRKIPAKADGQYSAASLPPGEYTVSANLQAGFTTVEARKITVVDKGCAEVDWPILYDSHIRGLLTDASGRPVADFPIALMHRDARSFPGMVYDKFESTGADGRYDFRMVSPGDYLVVANGFGPSASRAYPRMYYAGSESAEGAQTIHLAASGSVDDINITLPHVWRAVTIQARVLLADGSAAQGSDVYAYDANYTNTVEPARANADPEGRATLSVYEGRTYYLVATVNDGTQQRCAGPLKFTAKDGLSLPPIIVTHNWGNCLAQLNPEFRPPQ